MNIQFKSGCAYIDGLSPKTIKIPSAMYPLSGEGIILTHQNTSAFDDSTFTDTIRQIFDSVQAEIGRCYSNAKVLQQALSAVGIEARTLVGWFFVQNTPPVHHCLTCVEDHILDFNIRPELLAGEDIRSLPVSEQREAMVKKIIHLRQLPFSEVGTFGAMSEASIFFGAYCSPDKGREIYRRLMRAYPKHPAGANTDSTGASPIQQAILRRK